MEIVPETGQGSRPLYFSKLPVRFISASLLKTLLAAVFTVFKVAGSAGSLLSSPLGEVLTVAAAEARSEAALLAAVFLASFIAASVARRIAAAIAPDNFWSCFCLVAISFFSSFSCD